MVNTEDEGTNLESTVDLESQDNNNTCEKEACITMEVDTEVQIEEKEPVICSDTTGAIINKVQNVKVFRETAKEGLEKQAKKMKIASTKNFPKPTLGQNVKIKVPDIDRSKMDPKSVIAVITDIKDDDFYVLGTKFGKFKSLYTRNQFTFCKENFLNIEEVGTEEISVREVVKNFL